MSLVTRSAIAVTSDGAGAATVYSDRLTGRLHALRYVKTDFDNGHDFTATVESTGESIMVGTNVDATATFYPRVGVTDAAGAAATLDGTRLSRDAVLLANDRVKIVVAAAGATKTGTYYVVCG